LGRGGTDGTTSGGGGGVLILLGQAALTFQCVERRRHDSSSVGTRPEAVTVYSNNSDSGTVIHGLAVSVSSYKILSVKEPAQD
jgi:hypothetical protein